MPLKAVFLDVDGVLLDETKTPGEWIRLIGDVLSPALGGEPADWNEVRSLVAAAWPDGRPPMPHGGHAS